MTASGLTIVIFLFFAIIGLATLLLIRRTPLNVGEALLSPAFGIAASVIPTTLINEAGLPIGRFAAVEAIAFVAIALFVIIRRRGLIPWKPMLAISPVFVVAYALVGWPQLMYGFNWVSFSNNDMTNYSLAADRLISHGFYAPPSMRPDEIFRGYVPSYWFEYVLSGERTGVEMLLGLIASIAHLRGFQAFMPTIIAFNLGLVGATTSLGWWFRRRLSDAWLVGGLTAISPLTSLGTLYQLLAQVGGLTILTAQVSLLAMTATPSPTVRAPQNQVWLLFGLLIASQLFMYPELLPFAALTYLTLAVLAYFKKTFSLKQLVKSAVFTGAVVAAFSLWNLPRMVVLLAERIKTQIPNSGPSAHHAAMMFPYFLLPSGMSSLWGFTPITTFQGAALSPGIAVGMTLLICIFVFAVFLALKNTCPPAVMLAVMSAVGFVLFIKQVDFGIFKLGMYIQPFLIVIFSFAVFSFKKLNYISWFLICALIVSNIATQFAYAETSFNGPLEQGAAFVEVRDATTDKLLERLSSAEKSSRSAQAFISDTSNLVLGKYETGYVGSKPLFFLTTEFQAGLAAVAPSVFPALRPRSILYDRYGNRLITAARKFYHYYNFQFSPSTVASFMLANIRGYYNKKVLLHSGGLASVINRSKKRYRSGLVYSVSPKAVKNDLVFIQSTLGTSAGIGQRFRTMSLYQVEPDYFYRNATMSGIGRYLLFAILNPTRGARMLLNISDTLQSNGRDNLPPASIVGKSRAYFPLLGSGSARVVSSPIDPEKVDHYDLVGLDMGIPGRHFKVLRTGLMKLYGRNIQIDPRLLTAFARNISVISEAQYRSLRAPEYIHNLVKGIANHNLLYSGIYEDGWISSSAYLKLSTRVKNESLIVDGLVPLIKNPQYHETLTCTIDSHVIKKFHLHVGYFHLNVPTNLLAGNHTVEFLFSSFERLPGGDGRPISARFTTVGFK